VAVGSDCINSRITAAELFFNSRTRERYYRLGQALLERGHLIVLVQGGLYVLAELEPRELPLDLIDRVFQIPALLNVLEERSSQPLPGIEDRAADNPVPGLLYRRVLEAALPLLPLRNEAADDGILIDGQGFLGREFLRPVRIDPASYPTGRPYQVALRFVAGDNSLRINGDRPPEVVLNKGVNLSVLYYYILKHVAHITCQSSVSILHCG
jgi:hypothetical protein